MLESHRPVLDGVSIFIGYTNAMILQQGIILTPARLPVYGEAPRCVLSVKSEALAPQNYLDPSVLL